MSFSPQNYKVGNKWEKIDNTLRGATKTTKSLTLNQLALNTQPGADAPSEFSGKGGRIDAQMKPLAEVST